MYYPTNALYVCRVCCITKCAGQIIQWLNNCALYRQMYRTFITKKKKESYTHSQISAWIHPDRQKKSRSSGENVEKPTPMHTEKALNGVYPDAVYENCYFSDSLRAGRSGDRIPVWGRGDSPHLSRPALGSTHLPIPLVPGLSRG
jgi:hypothetical protein